MDTSPLKLSILPKYGTWGKVFLQGPGDGACDLAVPTPALLPGLSPTPASFLPSCRSRPSVSLSGLQGPEREGDQLAGLLQDSSCFHMESPTSQASRGLWHLFEGPKSKVP